jgi:hypothetical protein
LAGLLAQFKSDGPPGFPLSDRCAICRVAAGGDILDSDGDNVTATKLAVDRFGYSAAFLTLGAAAGVALAVFALGMPETAEPETVSLQS